MSGEGGGVSLLLSLSYCCVWSALPSLSQRRDEDEDEAGLPITVTLDMIQCLW